MSENRKPEGTPSASLFSLPTPCATLDRTGRVEFTNEAWATRPGTLASLVPVGRNLIEVLSGLSWGGIAAHGMRELVSGERSELTCDLCSDGSSGWTRLLASRDHSGTIVVLTVDVSDHPSARASVDSERRFQRIVDSAMDGIVTVNELHQIVLFNAAAERIFGVSASEAIGGALTRFIPARSHASHGSHMRAFGKTGVTTRAMGHLGTISGVKADGTEFPMEASISHVQVGSQQFYTVILRDVSERKRLEAQLLQSQKMEGVGRLAGGIAHDFNNILMAIFNYLALASRRLGPDHPVLPSLSQAQRAAERAADLTRQLLAFARKQVVAPKVLCPRDIATGLSSMLRRLIGEDVILRTAFDEDTGNVRVDAAQLEQVLVNLAVNARDAMPEGGVLTIETSNAVLDANHCQARIDAHPGEYVVISVGDTGTGMTPEVQARLFEPFFTTKVAGKGTGLGLATCHGIVRQCGGHMTVHSELGRGTIMRVFLPRVLLDVSTTQPVAPIAITSPAGTETVLLVEDSGLVRELIGEGLRTAGYTVIEAASGTDALRMIESTHEPIHLMLTDVVMPGMSGVQLAEVVLTKLPIPVIFMSGHTDEIIVQHGVDPERMTFIAKPFLTDTLHQLIHSVLKKANLGSPRN